MNHQKAIVHKIMNEQPTRIPAHYSEFIADMIDWMLSKNPENRPEISTIMQMPQMQKEVPYDWLIFQLWKLNDLYSNLKLKLNLAVKNKPAQL